MKCIFGMQLNIKVLHKLMSSFWVCIARHVQSTQNKKFLYLCNVSRKTCRIKLIFCLQTNAKDFYNLIVPTWVCVARQPKAPKTTSFQYLYNISRKAWRMKLIFFPVDKPQSFHQIYTIILCVCSQACTNDTK